MVSAAVFDLDGTLFYLSLDWEELFSEFKRIMHVDAIRPLVDTVSKAKGQTRVEVFKAWDIAELAVAKKVTVCQEGMNLYEKNAKKPKALVTLQGKKTADVVIKQFGLIFDVVITREDSLSRVEQLLKAIERLKVPAKEVLFIGNADTDALAAEKVGCQFRRVK